VHNLRLLVRELIKEIKQDASDEVPSDLLIEPDYPNEDNAENEMSVAAIAGVTTPLGTNATYPANSKKKKKPLPRGWQKSK
jgi:hypothetical protein